MYSVPLVPPDLRHEETIIQAINSLEYLHVTITNIFDRIDARIARNNAKINELKSRITSANDIVNNLVGINKAIKFFSPSKFPAAHVFRDISYTFESSQQADRRPDVQLNTEYCIGSGQDPVGHKNIQEKLVFYHVRGSKESSRLDKILDQRHGLGAIPANVRFVNSLLLYNTGVNLYAKKAGMDGASKGDNRGKQSALNGEASGRKIDAAPLSISHRQKGEKKPSQGLFYTPRLNEAPAMNVPVDLPDLPGIADDVTFDFAESEKIAPSLYIDDLPDLPDPVAFQTSAGKVENEKSSLPQSIPAPSSRAPPPPPPPPVLTTPEPKAAPSSASAAAPPPPPPPPPPIPPQVRSPEATDRTAQAKSVPDITDARSNLMEAIRKAGGARGGKLRAAADMAKKNEPQAGGKTNKSSGDLMADLHNKLSMRRKGISGAKESEDAAGGGSVINRLSALIPPPPVKPAQRNSSTTDASDEDDWAD